MKHYNILLLLFLSFSMYSQTSSIKNTTPLSYGQGVEVGMSEERLAKIDAMLNKSVVEGKLPGIVALIARNGKIVLHKSYGMSDNETGKPLVKDAIFRIASQTKAITATAVMILWEEGRFKLDDPISKYLPEFKEAQLLDTFKATRPTLRNQQRIRLQFEI